MLHEAAGERDARDVTYICFYLTRSSWRVFFAANREGILGVVPHAALYLAAEAIGRRAIWIPTAASRRRVAKHWSYRALGLAALSLAFWGAWAAAVGGARARSARGQARGRGPARRARAQLLRPPPRALPRDLVVEGLLRGPEAHRGALVNIKT